jgi:putative addiction module component (TIGR02574 family)
MKLDDLKQEALKLSLRDREELANALVLSLDEGAEPDPAHEGLWMEEIKRRCREIDEGRAKLVPADEVFRRARAALR